MGLFGKKYKCDTCGTSFKSQNELMEHAKLHMQTSQPSSFSVRPVECRSLPRQN